MHNRSVLSVCAVKCDQCLFSPDAIVSPQRRRDLLAQCEVDETYFICHKHSIAEANDSTLEGSVCCKGFYDQDHGQTPLLRLASALGVVVFIDEPIPVRSWDETS